MVQKRRRILWAKAHLKWTASKWKNVLWSDESKFYILVGNHRRRVLRAAEEGDLPVCYQRSVQKPASLMVWGCISAYSMGSLHVLEGTMDAERYIKVLEQHAKPHTAAITTAWLVVEESGCLIGLPAVQSLSPIENSWHKRKYVKDDHKLFSSWKPISGRNGTNSNTKTPETHNLERQTSSNCFEKKRRCYNHGKHAPRPNYLRTVAGITFEIAHLCITL